MQGYFVSTEVYITLINFIQVKHLIPLYVKIKVLCYILWPIKYTVYISTSPSWKAFSCLIIHTWLARRLRLTSGHKNKAKWNKATSARNKTLGETPQSRTSDYANGSEPLLFHKYFDSSSTWNKLDCTFINSIQYHQKYYIRYILYNIMYLGITISWTLIILSLKEIVYLNVWQHKSIKL